MKLGENVTAEVVHQLFFLFFFFCRYAPVGRDRDGLIGVINGSDGASLFFCLLFSRPVYHWWLVLRATWLTVFRHRMVFVSALRG